MDTENPYKSWLEAKANLQRAKDEELAIRNFICSIHLSEGEEGARTQVLTADGHDYKVVATAKLNRSIDPTVLDNLWDDLSELEQNAIQYKPSLRMANYKQLEAEGSVLTEAVTVKPAQSSLAIEEIDNDID